jgi:hypothetical protein
MKTLIAALILSSLTGPVLAMGLIAPANPSVLGTEAPSADEFGRRSGRCAHHPVDLLIPGQVVAREGSACGGV